MKKILSAVLTAVLLTSMILPLGVHAADGELLIEVDFLADTFRTVHTMVPNDNQFGDKFDFSAVTSDTLMIQKKAGCTTEVWEDPMWYVEDSGYYLTDDTKYTMVFEVASPHSTKYSGIALVHENDGYDSYDMMWGAFSDNGDNKDGDGNRWSEVRYVYNYGEMKYLLGSGYNSNSLSYFHPALQTEVISDSCTSSAVTEAKFCTMKVEFNGRKITTFYLDASNNWVLLENDGNAMEYEAEFGSEIVLGVYARNQERHNIIRNLKLLQGTGLSYTDILTAKQTSEPKPAKPETEEPTTAAPAPTEAPTTASEPAEQPTESPAQSDENKTDPADSEKGKESKGCKGSVVFVPVLFALAAGTVAVRRKRK